MLFASGFSVFCRWVALPSSQVFLYYYLLNLKVFLELSFSCLSFYLSFRTFLDLSRGFGPKRAENSKIPCFDDVSRKLSTSNIVPLKGNFVSLSLLPSSQKEITTARICRRRWWKGISQNAIQVQNALDFHFRAGKPREVSPNCRTSLPARIFA